MILGIPAFDSSEAREFLPAGKHGNLKIITCNLKNITRLLKKISRLLKIITCNHKDIRA